MRDRMILSTGYNGSIRGMPHCDDVGHLMEGGHCVATIHAEANAIIQAARNGVEIDGATIYVTASPCWSCFKTIANAGIVRVCYGEFYRDERIFEFATVNCLWNTNAYGSIVWFLLGMHTIHISTDVVDTGVLTALMFTGPIEEKRFVDVSENAMYWYFVVLVWLPVYGVIYWAPRLT